MSARVLLSHLAWGVVLLLGITALTFSISRWAPGDPLQLDPERGLVDTQAQRAREGLDAPLPLQYLRWLSKVVRFDLGVSLVDHRPVSHKLAEALPRTIGVAGAGLTLGWLLALPLGVWLVSTRRQRLSKVIAASATASTAVPTFWLAVLLLTLFANPRALNWFPFQGLHTQFEEQRSALDTLWHLALPVLCFALPVLASATGYVRAGMAAVMHSDFILAARARGLNERRVVWRHGLRATVATLLTALGAQLPMVLGGSAVIERAFGIPGMGLLAFDAVGSRDYPTVMASCTVMAVATLASMRLVDVLVWFADPRTRARPQS